MVGPLVLSVVGALTAGYLSVWYVFFFALVVYLGGLVPVWNAFYGTVWSHSS